MASACKCCLLLLSVLAVCSAASTNVARRTDLRVDGLEPFLQSLVLGVTGKADRVKTADIGREETFRRFSEGPAYLTVKFQVPPHQYDNFVREWSSLEKMCVKDQGNIRFDLKKTITDNVQFLAYSEWETRVDLFYHMISDHFQDFMDFTIKNNIVYELIPMRPVTDTKQERRATRMVNNVDRKSDSSSQQAHFLTRVILKPAEAEDFIDAWKDTAYKTYKEDGNAVYSLRQVDLNSNEFYIYGTWDSYADLNDHMTSKHVQCLLDFALDRDIVLMRIPLVRYDEAMMGSTPQA